MLTALLLASAAQATVPDTYGSGARLIGMGGGGVAVVEDGAAALVNPAGLYRIRRPTVTLGISTAMERFDEVPDLWWDTNRDGLIDDRDTPLDFPVAVDDAIGAHFSAGRNVGGKFALGASGYLPMQRMFRFSTFEPDLPNYFMYDNRPQRYALALGIGGQPIKGVSIGASIDFVPRAVYTLALSIDAQIVGTNDENGEVEDLLGDIVVDVHEMDLDVIPGFAPIVGLQVDVGQYVKPLTGLWLAASYRGSVGLPISVDLDLQANISAEDIGSLDPIVMAIILESGIGLFDHYVPSVLQLGAAYRAEDTLTFYVDVRRTNWAAMRLNVAQVEHADVTSPLVEIDDFVRDGNEHEVVFKPVASVRMGAELLLPRVELEGDLQYVRLMARGGFQWEPSPLVSQGASSALLDADRMAFSMGWGLETWDPFELVNGPVRVDLFGQYHVLARGVLPRESAEPLAGYPVEGTGLPIGGHIWMLGAQWGFDY